MVPAPQFLSILGGPPYNAPEMDYNEFAKSPNLQPVGIAGLITPLFTIPLIWIKDWDFKWQDAYRYKTPVRLPRSTRVEVRAYYDNSEKTPNNPNKPPKAVSWGEKTTNGDVPGVFTHSGRGGGLRRSRGGSSQPSLSP